MPHAPISFGDFGNLAVFLILVLMGLFALFAFSTALFSKNGLRSRYHDWIEKWKLLGKKDNHIIKS